MSKSQQPILQDAGKVWQQIDPAIIPSTLALPEEFKAAAQIASHILDIGCGIGSTARETMTVKRPSWVGIDINPAAIATASKAHLPDTTFLVHDARQPLPAADPFDLFLLKGVLTCLPTAREHIHVLRNAISHGAERRLFVIVDFLQDWSHPVYGRRYRAGERGGLEKGTFVVRDSPTSDPAYLAHHFEHRELIELLKRADLRLISFRTTPVRTRSGNEITGFVATAV